jgi:DNA polymerase-3 subunit alpha
MQRGKNIASLKQLGISGTYTIAAVVDEMKEIVTKKGDPMAFLRVSDLTDNIEVIIFPKTFKEFRNILQANEVYAFNGKLERKDDG